jgi:5-methylthioribose kinase
MILKNDNCKLHKILLHSYEDCDKSIELVFTEKYFENNSNKFIKIS